MNQFQIDLNEAKQICENLNQDINRLSEEKKQAQRQIPQRDATIEQWKQGMLETGEEKPFPTVPSREHLLQDIERISALLEVKKQALYAAQKRRDRAQNQHDTMLIAKKRRARERGAEPIREKVQDDLIDLWAIACVSFGINLGVPIEWHNFIKKVFPEPPKPENWRQMIAEAKERLLADSEA